MARLLRKSTLQTIGLGSTLDIFRTGSLPVSASDMVDKVFGKPGKRGCLVISGANGIVGAGKSMQLGSRLKPFDILVGALDFPGVPDGLGKQFSGLVRAFGPEEAHSIMENVIRFNYGGKTLPSQLKQLKPKFLLEAIPEILAIKKAHYETFRADFPDIQIRSVTSGFPSSQLGVGIAHPAFPHEINKLFEVVEPEPSDITKLLWSIGLIPMTVADNWAFVLDVMFCGLMLAGLRYHNASNMPFWKIDKYIRKYYGPNPIRAHDAIGAKGSNFLTWSCLHHLSKEYGDVFKPTTDMDQHKDSGQNWYPPNHFRPLVDWKMADDREQEFHTWIMGPLFQMTSLMLYEKRSHLSQINAIGELCAQFRNGLLAQIRKRGADSVISLVNDYHKLHPEAAAQSWYPEVFEGIESADWQQLYVNAEHDGTVGIITFNRESYNHDVNDELNRAIDWLKKEGITRVIVTGDFHLSTQLVGADTADFYPALEDEKLGFSVSNSWSITARRLHTEFATSVAFINGKRCMGGFLELLMHCHYIVADENAQLGMPEVTLPVVPGMEGCHWPFRKTESKNFPKLVTLLLGGKTVKAKETVGWLIDFACTMDDAIQMSWNIATGGKHSITKRELRDGILKEIPQDSVALPPAANEATVAARQAIFKTMQESLSVSLDDALDVQSKHSAGFMVQKYCKKGKVGTEYSKTMLV